MVGSAGDEFDALARRLNAVGCSPDEIAIVERDVGQPLPASYRRFLETMGRDGGGLFGGSDLCYPEMLGLQDAARLMLKSEDTTFVLPAGAVVFSMHQGYQFLFVTHSDALVRLWGEGMSSPSQAQVVADSLLELLVDDERSTSQSFRVATAAGRLLRFKPEPCPQCSGSLSWSGRRFEGVSC